MLRPLLALALGLAVHAQDFRATLQGTITDPQQANVANANVSLRNTETGVERTTTTDGDGFYVFQFLTPGTYSLTVKASGFRTMQRDGITLALSQTLREDVALALGDTTETIRVEANVSTVETDSTALGTAIRSEIRDNLPLKGRSSLFMFTLTPGVVNNRYGEDTRPNDTITNVLFSANGAPVAATDVFVDGVANTVNVNRGVNISQWVPAVDSIGEFKLEVGTLSAEYGRSGGSMTNMAIKSGTNQIRGTAYEFFRNSKLDANLFFQRGQGRPLAAFGANTYGIAVGGPIYIPKLYDGRNRTFWFANFEGAKEGNGLDRTLSVPTARMRTGDFSETTLAIYDPLSVATVNGVPTRTPFAGNVIPANRQDPVGRSIMSFYPTPNRTPASATQPWVNNFAFSGKWPRDYNMFSMKVDHQVSEKYSTFVRMNYGTALLIFPFDFDGIATDGRNIVNRPHFGVSWGNTFLLSSRRTLDVRMGYARAKEKNRPYSEEFDPTSLGFPSSYVNSMQAKAFPIIRVNGIANLAGSTYVEDPGYTYTLQPNFAEQRGKHLLKYGADLRLLYGNFFRNTTPGGSFSFTNAWTNGPRADQPVAASGFPLASLLLGTPASGTIEQNTGVSILNKYYGFFVQDDWRITSRLTLNLGLRYEFETPRTERYDRATRGFDRAARYNIGSIPAQGGLVYAGVNGLPRGIYDNDTNNFAPRIGLAWSLSQKTVFRAGYALNYVPIVGSVDPVGYSVSTPMVVSDNGIDIRNRLSNPFPQGQLTPVGNSQGLQTLLGQNISFVEPGDRTPIYHTWNANLQRQLFSGSLLQVGYIGGRGLHLTSEVSIGNNITENLNQTDPRFLSLGAGLNEVVNNPYFGLIASGPLSGRTVQRQQLLRPYPQFGNITRNLPAFGNSSYHSLQVKFETRAWKGLTSIISYTLSKNLTDVSPYQNTYNRRIERAPAAFDVPQRLTTTISWDVPVGRGRAFGGQMHRALDAVAGGWNIAMFNTFQSGFPLSFGTNANTLFLTGAGGQRPNVIGDPNEGISGSVNSRLNRYFNTAAFAQPANFTFGNAPARASWLRNPGMDNWNLTLTKTFTITERLKLNLRGSSFNLMNHPVFAGPNTTFGVAQFGVISAQANISRQHEIVLRLQF
ncbi:MAG: TonB-dependent receptor [Bryobacteraceae bacterium]|nr:TonB-dependent receptor [Bryobacteraceae bacterium]